MEALVCFVFDRRFQEAEHSHFALRDQAHVIVYSCPGPLGFKSTWVMLSVPALLFLVLVMFG
jgi:hypothetical protein